MGYYFSTPNSRAGYKIREFLNQIGVSIKLTNSSWKTNKLIFVPFLKENNIPYKKMNPNYKGINTADLENGVRKIKINLFKTKRTHTDS